MKKHLHLNTINEVVPQHCHSEDRRDEAPTLSRVFDIVGKSREVAASASLDSSPQAIHCAQGGIGLESFEKKPLDAKS